MIPYQELIEYVRARREEWIKSSEIRREVQILTDKWWSAAAWLQLWRAAAPTKSGTE